MNEDDCLISSENIESDSQTCENARIRSLEISNLVCMGTSFSGTVHTMSVPE